MENNYKNTGVRNRPNNGTVVREGKLHRLYL